MSYALIKRGLSSMSSGLSRMFYMRFFDMLFGRNFIKFIDCGKEI